MKYNEITTNTNNKNVSYEQSKLNNLKNNFKDSNAISNKMSPT